MVSKWNLAEHLDRTYAGRALVSFRQPDGEVRGPATLTLRSDGTVEVAIEINEFSIPPEYHGFLMPFLRGNTPEVNGNRTTFHEGTAQVITKLEVTTESGSFQGSRALIGNSNFAMFGDQASSITVVANDLQFFPFETQSADYWCLPLYGGLTVFRGNATACSVADQAPYFAFSDDSAQCGLEIVASDESGRERPAAIAFGEIGTRPHGTVEEALGLLPSGLLSMLSFAAGSDITSPYLELRTFDGRLARRLHLRLGSFYQEDGYAAFTKFDGLQPESGLGRFLDVFFKLAKDRRDRLIAPMNLIRSGAPGSATVDENIADMVKALDAFCKMHGFTHQNLASMLHASNASVVAIILQTAREALKQVRRQLRDQGEANEVALLDKIIARQANVATEERDFGIAVTGLLGHYGLRDAEAMNAYYLTHANVTWQQILSAIRGQVIHVGAIRIKDRSQLHSWFHFACHLHDVCKRIVLKEGKCQRKHMVDRLSSQTAGLRHLTSFRSAGVPFLKLETLVRKITAQSNPASRRRLLRGVEPERAGRAAKPPSGSCSQIDQS